MPTAQQHCAKQPGHEGGHRSAGAMKRNREQMQDKRAAGYGGAPTFTRHGLSVVQIGRLYARQSARCAVCQALLEALPSRSVVIEHDHAHCPGQWSCGECVRGIVCQQCNVIIGQYEGGSARLKTWEPGTVGAVSAYLAEPPGLSVQHKPVVTLQSCYSF